MQNPITQKSFLVLISLLACGVISGCAPMMAGQVAEAGYNVAKTSLGGAFDSPADKATAAGQDPRQQKIQSVLNSVDIGQDIAPIIESMGEGPKVKSGNAYGFTCYEYSAVYSATESAVILAKNGKVVFYGKSNCVAEMQDANFKEGGKYANTSPL
ncbi:MAG TPA: hypothetical protein VIP51_04700 [Eoetvoesiella sp.]